MIKIDFKKEMKQLYKSSSKNASIVEVPPMKFLMIDGKGDPNSSKDYKEAVEVLYGLSYTLKFSCRKNLEKDYVVPPLEGLWWADDMENFQSLSKDEWKWTSLIMQPDFITEQLVREAFEEVKLKKNPPALSKVRFETFNEGLTAQIMHIGPYAEEEPTIIFLHNFIHDKGYNLSGLHHEIYLSDPRRCKPEKMKTIIRQPITEVED